MGSKGRPGRYSYLWLHGPVHGWSLGGVPVGEGLRGARGHRGLLLGQGRGLLLGQDSLGRTLDVLAIPLVGLETTHTNWFMWFVEIFAFFFLCSGSFSVFAWSWFTGTVMG